jgi:hypothetical protein
MAYFGQDLGFGVLLSSGNFNDQMMTVHGAILGFDFASLVDSDA